MIFVDFDPC